MGSDRDDGFGEEPMIRRPRLSIAAALIVLLAPCCALPDTPVPWDTSEIVRDVSKSLSDNKLLISDLERTEVLAWHIARSTEINPNRIPPTEVSQDCRRPVMGPREGWIGCSQLVASRGLSGATRRSVAATHRQHRTQWSAAPSCEAG